jgi:N-ethylmaleimide reductase
MPKPSFPNLLSPASWGSLQVANRVWMAPMTRSRATPDGVPSELAATYYSQRAGAGLIVSEAINVSAEAVGSPLTPGLYTDAQVQSWAAITTAVHVAGGRIVAQLWHTGRVGHSSVRGGLLPVAPSPIAIQGQRHFTGQGMEDYEVPRELSLAEIRATIADYVAAALRALEAGFDGVEVHGAFGYLPNQFLVDGANQRQDLYGGSIANRCRFVLEVMEGLIAVWGAHRVGIKLSPVIPINGMVDSDPKALFTHLLRELDALHPGYLHLMNAMVPLDAFPHWPKDVVGTFGRLTRIPLVANGGYDAASAEAELASGRADFISFGNLFIANPDLVERFTLGAPLAKAEKATFYGGGAHGYVDYPALHE